MPELFGLDHPLVIGNYAYSCMEKHKHIADNYQSALTEFLERFPNREKIFWDTLKELQS